MSFRWLSKHECRLSTVFSTKKTLVSRRLGLKSYEYKCAESQKPNSVLIFQVFDENLGKNVFLFWVQTLQVCCNSGFRPTNVFWTQNVPNYIMIFKFRFNGYSLVRLCIRVNWHRYLLLSNYISHLKSKTPTSVFDRRYFSDASRKMCL